MPERVATAPGEAATDGSTALPAPRRSQIGERDLLMVLGALAGYVMTIWVLHGGITDLHRGSELLWTSLTQLTGLASSLCGLIGLLLISRPAWIERLYGMDRMFVWHRLLGEAMAILLGIHVVTGVEEYASEGGGVWGAIRDLTGREAYMAGAFVGAVLIGLVTITSLRTVRRRLSYESWYFVHLLAYFGFAVSFGHEIVLGGSLSDDRGARALWVLLHVVVLAAIVVGRWGRTLRSVVRPMRVASITPQNAGVSTMRLRGPGMRSLEAEAGQFFIVRPLRRGLWWQAHPFSLSAAPTTAGLAFTVKNRGDATDAMVRLPVGTKVAVEGPYGVSTPTHLNDRDPGGRYLFVAGGVGIAPVKALLECLDASSRPVVLYRAHAKTDLVHLGEIEALVAARGGVVHTLVGPSAKFAGRDPFSAKSLRQAVPDVADRVAVLCGPERLVAAARHGVRAAGVPSERIHFERVWW